MDMEQSDIIVLFYFLTYEVHTTGWSCRWPKKEDHTLKLQKRKNLLFFSPPGQWSISENISSCKKWNSNILNLTIKGYFLRMNERRKCPLIVWLSLFFSRRDFSTMDSSGLYSSLYDGWLNVRSHSCLSYRAAHTEGYNNNTSCKPIQCMNMHTFF